LHIYKNIKKLTNHSQLFFLYSTD